MTQCFVIGLGGFTPPSAHCDLCYQQPVAYRYPAKSFEMPMNGSGTIGQTSIGDWAACEVCHHMIEAADTAGLAVRSLNLSIIENPDLERISHPLYNHLVRFYTMFMEHRTAEAIKL